MDAAKRAALKKRKQEERDRIFPKASSMVWNPDSKGFAQIPRVLPLILLLMSKADRGTRKSRDTAKGGNPARAYLDFWFMAWEMGFIKIESEQDLAYSAGYQKSRGLRTWRDHVARLEQLGWIETKERGNLRFGYVLLRNPYEIVFQMRRNKKLDEAWWNAFCSRADDFNIPIPPGL